MTQKWNYCYELKPGRWVFPPSKDARRAGVRIKRAVASRWGAPDFYYHLRPGGHVAAVRLHAESKFFFRADIDDFFGRVNRSRVTRCLKQWFAYSDAREMASESVVKRPELEGFVLPYGFVQSPLLASLALDKSRIGSYLRMLDAQGDVRVSVYVDDIIISGDDDIALLDVAQKVEALANGAGFPISPTKKEGPSATVTAFNIAVSHGSLSLTADRLTKFRTAYAEAVSGFAKDAIEAYVRSINPSQW